VLLGGGGGLGYVLPVSAVDFGYSRPPGYGNRRQPAQISFLSPRAMSARSLLGQGGQAPLFYALPLCGLGSGIEIDANLFQIRKANKR